MSQSETKLILEQADKLQEVEPYGSLAHAHINHNNKTYKLPYNYEAKDEKTFTYTYCRGRNDTTNDPQFNNINATVSYCILQAIKVLNNQNKIYEEEKQIRTNQEQFKIKLELDILELKNKLLKVEDNLKNISDKYQDREEKFIELLRTVKTKLDKLPEKLIIVNKLSPREAKDISPDSKDKPSKADKERSDFYEIILPDF